MSQPILWPGPRSYLFYPLGNTSAVNLARDVGFDDDARVLLLGCGDPRNVLFTIFSEPKSSQRTLDFTCCDIDPAIIARNVFLFTMIMDHKHDDLAVLWNAFFHMKIDDTTLAAIVSQCETLLEVSSTPAQWDSSQYGRFLRFCTENTLPDIRRHWQQWIDFGSSLDAQSKARWAERFDVASQAALKKAQSFAAPAARAFGPLMPFALQFAIQSFKRFWTTGTTFTDPASVSGATCVNPMFLYSLGGEGFYVHYGTDPFCGFHLAPLLAQMEEEEMPDDILDASKYVQKQFSSWCSAYRASVSGRTHVPIVRFAAANAIPFCHSLRAMDSTQQLNTSFPIRDWRAQRISLSHDYLADSDRTSTFNVIDTSNLTDHIGILNVLIISTPLLSAHGVLYTASLRPGLDDDISKHFTDSLHADITVLSLLLRLAPVDFISGFTAKSSTHEALAVSEDSKPRHHHQSAAWRTPNRDIDIRSAAVVFDARELGTFLYTMYLSLFGQEDPTTFLLKNLNPRKDYRRALADSNITPYGRETFVLFLSLIRERAQISTVLWSAVMNVFLDLQEEDRSRKMDTVNAQDFYIHLYLHGVHTMSAYPLPLPRIGIFRTWRSIPIAVRVFLVVPRDAPGLDVLRSAAENTLPLVGDMHGVSMHNIFSTLQIAFGRVIATGPDSSGCPGVHFEEDEEGWNGSAPFVVSFVMPTLLLTNHDPQSTIRICLSLRMTPVNGLKFSNLNRHLNLFCADLFNKELVHVIPCSPYPVFSSSFSPSPSTASPIGAIGTTRSPTVVMDKQCSSVTSLSVRTDVTKERVKSAFSEGGANAQASQIGPCTMRLQVASGVQDVIFPFPIIGSKSKLRLARKSHYAEIVAPPATHLDLEKMKQAPFPVVFGLRVNLNVLPSVDLTSRKLHEWLDPHLGAMFSVRERRTIKRFRDDFMPTNDVLALTKYTLHKLLVASCALQGGRVHNTVILKDEDGMFDTIIFIAGMKYDLGCDTVVTDGYIVPLYSALLPRLKDGLLKIIDCGDPLYHPLLEQGELAMWKHLIPACVERCRTWKHTPNCEYRAQSKIPLSEGALSNPLCSCGEGKDVEGMSKNPLWRPFAPYASRVALSPLFGVLYLEQQSRDFKCSECRGEGVLKCSSCHDTRYCSPACQKKDWPRHKRTCKKI